MRWRDYRPGNRLTLARNGRINRLSGGLCDSDYFEAVKDRMATLMAAGFMSICKPTPTLRVGRGPVRSDNTRKLEAGGGGWNARRFVGADILQTLLAPRRN